MRKELEKTENVNIFHVAYMKIITIVKGAEICILDVIGAIDSPWN